MKSLLDTSGEVPAFLHSRQLEFATILLAEHLVLPDDEEFESNGQLLLDCGTTTVVQDQENAVSKIQGTVSNIPSFFGWICSEIQYEIVLRLDGKSATIDWKYRFKTCNRLCFFYFKAFMLKTVEGMLEKFISATGAALPGCHNAATSLKTS